MRRQKRNTRKLMLVTISLLIVALAASIELDLLDIRYHVLIACFIMLLILVLIIQSVITNGNR